MLIDETDDALDVDDELDAFEDEDEEELEELELTETTDFALLLELELTWRVGSSSSTGVELHAANSTAIAPIGAHEYLL